MNMIIYPTLFTNYSELYGNKKNFFEWNVRNVSMENKGKQGKPLSPRKKLSTPLFSTFLQLFGNVTPIKALTCCISIERKY